jgi:hypothetical protein
VGGDLLGLAVVFPLVLALAEYIDYRRRAFQRRISRAVLLVRAIASASISNERLA